MLRHRLLDLAFVSIAVVVVASITTRCLAPRATATHNMNAISLGTLRVGQYLSHHVQVPLPATVAPEALNKVVATCGCTALESWRLDGDGRTLDVNLTTEPGPYTTESPSTLQLYFKGADILEIPIHIAIEPPFSGWPAEARGYPEEDRFIISLGTGYQQIPLVIHCYTESGTSLFCSRTSSGDIAIYGVDPLLLNTYELTISFPDGTSTHVWAGPLAALAISEPDKDEGAYE